jgi:hypothetical protein
MKTCSICKAEKAKSEFHKDRGKRDGLAYDCKSCNKQRSRKDLIKHRYGISVEEYEAIVGDHCQICKATEVTLCMDHCHETGNLRGGLCNSCNSALGLFRENPEFVQTAANYLKEKHV